MMLLEEIAYIIGKLSKENWKIREFHPVPNNFTIFHLDCRKKMLSRLVCTKSIVTTSLLRNAIQHVPRRQQFVRKFAEESKFRTRAERINEKISLKERIMAPAGKNAFAMGKGALVGGSAIGLGALCFYGIGLGSGVSTLENSQ